MSEHCLPGIGTIPDELAPLVFAHAGMELTFCDENDILCYYYSLPDPIFARNPDILGTHILDCHPKSIHKRIMDLIKSLKTGESDAANILHTTRDGRRLLDRYIAVRDERGVYRGCLETVMDISSLEDAEPARQNNTTA